MQRRHLLSLLMAPPVLAQTGEAEATVAKLWQRYRHGVETEQETLRITLEREGAPAERKRLQRSIRYRPDGGFLVLVRFLEPALDRGLSLLIDQPAKEPALLMLRMPSWPQARRLAADREARSFGGTELTFEDNRQLLGERLSDWRYAWAGATAIEATPKAASGYAKRRLLLRGDGELAAIDYLDPQGRLLKQQTHEQIGVEGGRWRADRVRVQHRQESRSTLIEVEERRFGVALPESGFQAQLNAA